MSRILWLSNAPWTSSGYAEQTALFTRRLRALGHDVAIACNWGLHEMITTWDGFTVYPSDGTWGDPYIETYAKHHNADLVIALCDAWVLHPEQWPDQRVAIWAPVDHYPIPPKVLGSLNHPNVMPIAMSRFGERMMRDTTLDPVYVPHGYDPKVFRPQPELKDKVRDRMEIPRDAFLVGMVAANKGLGQSRKAFPQALHAFANLHSRHPDAYLYMHTDPVSGMNLDLLRKTLGIPDDRIMFPTKEARLMGIPPSWVAYLYQAFDVLLSPSMGEGFGVPIIEAQATGCPVIVSDHSAMPELAEAGWIVGGDPWWDEPAEAFFIVPSISQITEALEEAYQERRDPARSALAVEAVAEYNADVVTIDQWVPALEKLAAVQESRQVRRARARKAAKQKVMA